MFIWPDLSSFQVIAVTTYVALRHPLARFKAMVEKCWGYILGIILVVGLIQAILWQFLHGVSESPPITRISWGADQVPVRCLEVGLFNEVIRRS